MALHKGFFYYSHVIRFWSSFALLFQKFIKSVLISEKQSRVSSIKVSETFPIGAFLWCAAD